MQGLEGTDQPGGVLQVLWQSSTSRRPVRRVSGTCPTIPKSTKVSCQAGLPVLRLTGQRRHEQVAGMRVGMEETILEDLLEVGIQQLARHLGPVNSGRADGIIIGNLDGKHIFQRQHPARGMGPDHPVAHARAGRL